MKKNDIYKSTVSLLLISAFFDGFFNGFNSIQDIIAKKALHATDWQLMVLAMVWPVTNFLAIWWGKILEQSKSKAIFFWILAVFARGILLGAYFITDMSYYLILYGTIAFFNGLYSPASNSIYQNNLPHNHSKIYGYTRSIMSFVSLIFAFWAGRAMDVDTQHMRFIFIIASFFGFISCSILSFIKIADTKIIYQKKMKKREIFITPLARAWQLLKTNRAYAHFQRDFTLYGFGILSLSPVIPIYLVENMNLTYTQSFISKGILGQIGLLILSPILGKMHDNFHPFKFASISFYSIALYPLMLLTTGFLWSHHLQVIGIYLTFLIMGLAMSGINMAWNMSSIHFAGDEDVSMYQSLHVTITGIRGLLAPILGIVTKNYLGIEWTFVISFAFFFAGASFAYHDYKLYSAGKL